VQASMADNTQAAQAAEAMQAATPASTVDTAPSSPGASAADLDQAAANAGAKAGAFEAIKDKVQKEGWTKNVERGKRFLASMDGPVGEGARSVMAMQESKAKTEKARLDDAVSRKAAAERGVVLPEQTLGDQFANSPLGRGLGNMADAFRGKKK
jgi:hypothetical protein